LLRIIARAHNIQARLIQNPKLSVHDIAREERVSAAYLYILLRLPWLAPGITTAIINGRKPPQLTAQTLMRLTPRLPAAWAEQRTLLGFRQWRCESDRRRPCLPNRPSDRNAQHAPCGP